jgi:gas vesicle protein
MDQDADHDQLADRDRREPAVHLEDMTSRIIEHIDGLRDRTAEAVKADGESTFRAVAKLGDRIDRTEDALLARIDDLDDRVTEQWHDVRATSRRTSWPRRLFWLALGAAAGTAVAYLADPDRGRARRAQLGDQVGARARDLTSEARDQAKMAVDRARGAAIETAKEAMPEDVPTDPKLLQDRIKSSVFGHRDDVSDVVIKVDAPGSVALKGTVPDARSEQELLASVSEVDGVLDVRSELSIRR